MAETRSLDELVEEVAKEGRAVSNFFNANSYYQPSFTPGGFREYPELPNDVQESRRKLREAAKAVHDLAAGPADYLKWQAWSVRPANHTHPRAHSSVGTE